MDDFVGRQPELAFLAGELEFARAGQLRVVTVEGEQGTGKTSLVRRFLEGLRAGGSGERVLYASADEVEQAVSFGVVSQLLDGLSADADEGLLAAASAPAEPIQVGGALVSLVGRRAAGGRLTVLVVDDIPWADLSSQQVLAFALRRLRADPVLCLFTVPSTVADQLSDNLRRVCAEAGHRLRLTGLTVEEIRTLADALGAPPPTVRVARQIHELTGGNPLHARALLEELSPEALAGRVDPLPAPRSFGLMVLGRLAGCPPPTQQLVVAAAVLGRSCPLAYAARLADVDDPLAALEPAIVAGLLTEQRDEGGPRVAFPHPLTRAAVYHDLGPARRGALHRRAADIVADPSVRLRHRVEGAPLADEAMASEVADAATAAAMAGRWANAGDLWFAAARLTADVAARDRYLTDAVAISVYGGQAEAAAKALAASAAVQDPARRAFVTGALALVRGDFASGTASLRRAWQELEDRPDPALAAVVAESLAATLCNPGTYAQAADWADHALRAETAGQPRLVHYLALVANLCCGRPDRGRELVATAAATFAGAAHVGDEAAGMLALLRAELLWMDERHREALAELRTAAAMLRRGQPASPSGLSALLQLAWVEYQLGHWDDAIAHGALAASLAADSDQLWIAEKLAAVTVWPLAGRGAAETTTYLRQAEADFTRLTGVFSSMLLLARARVAHSAADDDGVAAALVPFTEQPSDDPIEPAPVGWQPMYAEALARLGRTDEAAAVLAPWQDAVDARGHRTGQFLGFRAQAMVDQARGEPARAAVAYQRAQEAARDLPLPFERAILDHDHGLFLLAERRRTEATAALRAARDRFAALGAAPYLARCEVALATLELSPTNGTAPLATTLTPQELNVARLAADGLSNNEIADQMVLSVRTIEFHLSNVYAKTGLRRTQLASELSPH